ncbi:MAG: penicillin-binding protein activator [Nitrosomonas sp. PRO4]|nr:penicillin-binding protein activator [Nitrosomonas sp. PRO4]
MQRFFRIFIGILTLLASSIALATPPEDQLEWENISEPPLERHIALLLPLESSSFAQAAENVKEGFSTAAMRETPLPLVIRIYSTTDDPLDIFASYHEAIAAGAVFIVGPLTRDGVSALASSKILEVPTLALNTVDNSLILPSNLYLFGLQMEAEANELGKLALSSNKTHAIVIGDDSSLSRRLQNAFTERWQSEAGRTAESFHYDEDPAKLQQFRTLTTGTQHLIFLALDAPKSRRLRAYLDPEVPVYATSQVFSGNDNFLLNNDLNGIYFVDMPWLLQPDHPAVMAYRHADKDKSTDMQRLYALGIDAFRLMAHLLQLQPVDQIAFDGVTGFIRYNYSNQFIREPIAAQFQQGKAQLIKTPADFIPHERQ